MGATQPDVVMPSQYFTPHRKQAPEQLLMIAVLHEALDCLEKHRFATDSANRRLFDETMQWFQVPESEWPYSFENICGVLDLDSNAVRRRLGVTPQPQNVIGNGEQEPLVTPQCEQVDPDVRSAAILETERVEAAL